MIGEEKRFEQAANIGSLLLLIGLLGALVFGIVYAGGEHNYAAPPVAEDVR